MNSTMMQYRGKLEDTSSGLLADLLDPGTTLGMYIRAHIDIRAHTSSYELIREGVEQDMRCVNIRDVWQHACVPFYHSGTTQGGWASVANLRLQVRNALTPAVGGPGKHRLLFVCQHSFLIPSCRDPSGPAHLPGWPLLPSQHCSQESTAPFAFLGAPGASSGQTSVHAVEEPWLPLGSLSADAPGAAELHCALKGGKPLTETAGADTHASQLG
jgi:hypothetical protein